MVVPRQKISQSKAQKKGKEEHKGDCHVLPPHTEEKLNGVTRENEKKKEKEEMSS